MSSEMIQDQICKMEERKRIEDLENKILELDKSLTSFQQKEFLEYWGGPFRRIRIQRL